MPFQLLLFSYTGNCLYLKTGIKCCSKETRLSVSFQNSSDGRGVMLLGFYEENPPLIAHKCFQNERSQHCGSACNLCPLDLDLFRKINAVK